MSDNLLNAIFSGTDCTFIFPESDDKCVEIHANRKIIENASEFLKAKFDTYKRNTLVVQNVKPSVFKMILTHAYTNELPKPEILSQDVIFDMYEAAQKYQFKFTTNCLILHMKNECKLDDMEKFLSYLNFVLKHYIIQIQNYCQKVLECNADVILHSAAFLNTHPRVINWIYSLSDLNIDEWDLIQIIEKYKALHDAAGRHAISTKIQPAINSIRFLSMTAEIVDRTTVLSPEEKHCLKLVILDTASDSSVPMYLSRLRIGRCFNGINIICNDTDLRPLIEQKKIKLGILKGQKYFVTKDGTIKATIDESGKVVPVVPVWTPMKEISTDSSKSKKTCAGIQQSVLFYKENKKIMLNKPGGASKKDSDEDETTTASLEKLSIKKPMRQ